MWLVKLPETPLEEQALQVKSEQDLYNLFRKFVPFPKV